MNAIVSFVKGQAVTTSLAIAEGTEVQHKNVLELVRTYRADLEEFGLVAFQTRPRPEGQQIKWPASVTSRLEEFQAHAG